MVGARGGGGYVFGVGAGEEVEVETGEEVAAADGEEAVGGLLGEGGGVVDGAGTAGVGVDEVLEGGAVGRVVVPDGELEEGRAEEEEELRLVAFLEGRLERNGRLAPARLLCTHKHSVP